MPEHYETCRTCRGDGSIDTSRDPRHVHGTTCRTCSGFGTVEVKCDCCRVEPGEIETGWPDIRKLCLKCAAGIVRDLDDQPDEARLLAEKLEELAKIAQEKDIEMWIERIGDGENGAIVLEDGEIKSTKE